jgi:hypothetical protein
MERYKPHTLSPVPEEGEDEKVKDGHEVTEKQVSVSSSGSESDDETALPLELDVHGLKAKVYLNCADVDIIPARYLEKADRSGMSLHLPFYSI